MAIKMKTGTNKFQRGGGEKGSLLHCWWECKPVQPLCEVVWNCLRIFRIHLPYDPGIPLWCIYPKILETLMHRDPCITVLDRKSTRLNSSHANISYAVFCLKKNTITL